MSTEHETQTEQTLIRLEAAQSVVDVEAVRVEALGKAGWISQLMKTLGKMTPEERQTEAPRIQSLHERQTRAARLGGVRSRHLLPRTT